MSQANLEKFDHLVVLMLENRSFDNLFGYLYENDAPKQFLPDPSGPSPLINTVVGKDLFNIGPNGDKVPVSRAPYESQLDMTSPSPDPGEEYPHVNNALYGKKEVPVDVDKLPNPAPGDGWVKDYYESIQTTEGWENIKGPTPEQYGKIMHCFPEAAVPVLTTLARNFAVSDAWHCSVPSQTFTNRSFFHSASSHGFVNNSDYVKWLDNTQPTIMNRLTDNGLGWRVYWDGQDLVGSVTRILQPALYDDKFNDHFRLFENFAADCAAGDLPHYTFIEPRLLFNHNDMHPPVYLNPEVDSSILAGEILVKQVYDAIRGNQKLWERTLLVITFDEHGGTYDHVSPPLNAVPPEKNPSYPLECGFRFNRFGVRIPTFLISPYIEAGTVFRSDTDTVYDHTSIIRTIRQRWGLTEPLTDRDAHAPTIAQVLTRASPREDNVELEARPYTPLPEPHKHHSLLSKFQRGLIEMVFHRLKKDPPNPKNVHEALECIEQVIHLLPGHHKK